MSIGILIIAHGDLGQALIGAASHVLGQRPERLAAMSAGHDEPRELAEAQARTLVAQLDAGAGVLVLTDLFGASTANIARGLLQDGRVAGIAGVSLPMVLRAVNYRHLPLAELIEKVTSAASECTASLS